MNVVVSLWNQALDDSQTGGNDDMCHCGRCWKIQERLCTCSAQERSSTGIGKQVQVLRCFTFQRKCLMSCCKWQEAVCAVCLVICFLAVFPSPRQTLSTLSTTQATAVSPTFETVELCTYTSRKRFVFIDLLKWKLICICPYFRVFAILDRNVSRHRRTRSFFKTS
jgi:hypothetical protein